MIKIGSTVCVTWLDAYAGADPSAMVSMEEAIALHKPSEVKTYGMLLVQDEVGITLVAEYFPESLEYRGRTFVPAGMIKDVQALKVPRSRIGGEKAKRAKNEPKGDVPPMTGV